MNDADPRAYERDWMTRALRGLNRIYARAWHRVEVLSPCKIPSQGPAILICNHSAGLDPVILQATCPRLVTWMMAKEYYDLPGLGAMARRLGYIPVSRGGRDSASLKLALRALAAGKVLGIFPEGRIEPSQQLLPFHGGVAVMAERAQVPVYPAYIAGLMRNQSVGWSVLGRQDARIAYGPPLRGTEESPLTAKQLHAAVDALRRRTLAQTPLRSRFLTRRGHSDIGVSLTDAQNRKIG